MSHYKLLTKMRGLIDDRNHLGAQILAQFSGDPIAKAYINDHLNGMFSKPVYDAITADFWLGPGHICLAVRSLIVNPSWRAAQFLHVATGMGVIYRPAYTPRHHIHVLYITEYQGAYMWHKTDIDISDIDASAARYNMAYLTAQRINLPLMGEFPRSGDQAVWCAERKMWDTLDNIQSKSPTLNPSRVGQFTNQYPFPTRCTLSEWRARMDKGTLTAEAIATFLTQGGE